MMEKFVKRTGVGLTLFLFWAGMACGQAPPSASHTPVATKVARDHAGSYYHFMLARRYEVLAGIYNRPDYVARAISEFKAAIADDPNSPFLHAQLGDLYWRAGKLAEATAEAQLVLKANPNDLDAHRLLGHIYVQELGQTSLQASVSGNLEKAIHEYQEIGRLDPKDTRSRILLGRLYQLANQPEKASQIFKEILTTDPNSTEALDDLGKLDVSQAHYRQAVQVLEKIPAQQRSSRTFYLLGLAYSQLQNFDQAAQNFGAALAMQPVNPEIRRQYAEALLRSGKNDLARTQFQQVLNSDPKDGHAYLRLAQIDEAEGHFQRATQELDQAQKLLPDSLEVAYTQAHLQNALGHPEAAIKILQGLLSHTASANGRYSADQATDRGAFLERLGLIYRSQEKYAEAISIFQQMIPLGPDQAAQGNAVIVETLQLEGQLSKALETAQQALRKYPHNQSLNLLYASVLGSQGHVDEAVSKLRDFIKTDGPSVQAQLQIAQIYSQAKRYRDAQEETEKVLREDLKPSDKEFAQFLLGSIYEHQKKYDQAEQQFKAVLAANPFNSEAFNYLGYMLADRGVELQQSVDYIKKALALQPNNGAYLDSLGWAYYKMGRYDLAREPLEKASQLMANDPTILMHLGHLYVKLGDKKLAVQTWKRALSDYPSELDADFDAAQAAKLQKRLHRLEHQLSKKQ